MQLIFDQKKSVELRMFYCDRHVSICPVYRYRPDFMSKTVYNTWYSSLRFSSFHFVSYQTSRWAWRKKRSTVSERHRFRRCRYFRVIESRTNQKTENDGPGIRQHCQLNPAAVLWFTFLFWSEHYANPTTVNRKCGAKFWLSNLCRLIDTIAPASLESPYC